MYGLIKILQDAIDTGDAIFEQINSNTRQTYFVGKIKDTGTVYTVTVEIPGYEKNEINLSIVGDYLYLDAKNNERSCKKSFLLPTDVSKEGLDAELKNGILKITIPKKVAGSNRVRVEIR